MAELKVRIAPAIKKKIVTMAKRKKMSQNEFVCAHLERIALQENVFLEEQKRIEELLLVHTQALNAFEKMNVQLLQKMGQVEQLLVTLIEKGE